MKAVAEEKLEITNTFVDEMDFCLDCQACESACPAGVQYGQLVEHARALIVERGRLSVFRKWIQQLFFRHMLPHAGRMQMAATIIRRYEESGLRWLVENLAEFFFPRLAQRARLLPSVSARHSLTDFSDMPKVHKDQRRRLGLLAGCLMNVFYHRENVDTVRLLVGLGFDVVVPPGQGCCGSLPGHYGDIETARMLALNNMKAFNEADVDLLVMNSAGCGAFMKDYGTLFEGTPYHEEARKFSERVLDLSELLVRQQIDWPRPTSAFVGKRVTFHDPCHLVHTQRIFREPRQLIRAVEGVQFVELPESTWCCGSAGLYNVIRPNDSGKLLERKLNNLRKTDAHILITSNHGCMAQLAYGVRMQGLPIRLMHIATFLREAYGF